MTNAEKFVTIWTVTCLVLIFIEPIFWFGEMPRFFHFNMWLAFLYGGCESVIAFAPLMWMIIRDGLR
jgi:hypothetical protein